MDTATHHGGLPVKTMQRKHNNTVSTFFMVGCLLIILNGCVTEKLWYSYPEGKKENTSAGADQIYFSCMDDSCRQQKLAMPYKIKPNRTGSDNTFPPVAQGYLAIDNPECLCAISEGIKVLLADPSLTRSASLHIQLMNVITPDGSRKQFITFEIRAKLPQHPDTYGQFSDHPELFRYSLSGRSYFDDAGGVISKGMTVFSLGPAKCGNREYSGLANIVFSPDLGFSPAKNHWQPMIARKAPSNIHILFINKKMKKVYRRSAAERIILTPFSLAADVIIVPIAVITAGLWMPR